MKTLRSNWNEFPDVVIHANESIVKKHPAYIAAKSGDTFAAKTLVRETFSTEKVEYMRQTFGGFSPILVSAHAYENEGVNAIPEVFASQLAEQLGWAIEENVVQTNVVTHTGANGFARLARQPNFDGAIKGDSNYLIVDDFVGMGGTLANLRGYVHSAGGVVVAATVLTGKGHSAVLSPRKGQIELLRSKHGSELENWWFQRFNHTIDTLTESEVRYLINTADFDTIRDRIVAIEQAGDRESR